LLLLQVQLGETLLNQLHLIAIVEDDEVFVQADLIPIFAQDAGTGGVKGADPHHIGRAPHQVDNPFPHLPGRSVGKGNAEHIAGMDPVMLDEVGRPVREYSCLAGPSPSEDQKWPGWMDDSLFLGRIQVAQDIHFITPVEILNQTFSIIHPFRGERPATKKTGIFYSEESIPFKESL